jgi:hypothetical protein
MPILLLLILLVLLFGGLGFGLHILWFVAVVWAVVALIHYLGHRSGV